MGNGGPGGTGGTGGTQERARGKANPYSTSAIPQYRTSIAEYLVHDTTYPNNS